MGSTSSLDILIRASDQASGTLKGIGKEASGLGGVLGSVSKIAGGIVLGGGLLQAPGALLGMAQAAADDAASIAKLQQAVENSGGVWETYKGTLEDVVEAAQKRGFTDDAARDALSLLTAQTGSAEEAAKRFAMAQDLARGANIDVVTASKLLGKVTDENVNVLSRYGIAAKEGMTETELFGMVQEKFGGQADVFAKSTAGQMAAAKIQMGELQEKIGYAVLPVLTSLTKLVAEGLVPAFSKLVDEVGPKIKAILLPAFEGVKTVFGFLAAHKAETIAALIGIGTAITAVMIPATIAWTVAEYAKATALLASAAAFVAANAPLIAIGAAIAVVVAGVVLLVQHWDDITARVPILKTAISAVTDFFTGTVVPVIGTVVGALQSVIGFATDNWPIIKYLIAGPFFPLVALATDAFGVRTALTGAFTGVKDFVADHWPEIATILSGPFAPLVILATDGFGIRSKLIEVFTALPGTLAGLLTAGVGAIFEGAKSLGAAIKDGIIAGISAAGGLATDLLTAIKNGIVTIINDCIGALNAAIPNSLGPIDLPDNPIPLIALAQGGIVRRPTLALLGERGAEAVIPLGRGVGMTTNNYYEFSGPLLSDTYGRRMFADWMSKEGFVKKSDLR